MTGREAGRRLFDPLLGPIRRSIRLKYSVPVVAVLFTVILMSGGLSVWRQYSSMEVQLRAAEVSTMNELRRSTEALTRTIELACRQAIVGNDYAFLSILLSEVARGRPDLDHAMIIDPTGLVLVHTDPALEQTVLDDPLTQRILASRDTVITGDTPDRTTLLEVARPIVTTQVWGYVRLAFDKTSAFQRMDQLRAFYREQIAKTLLSGAATTVALLLVGLVLTLWINARVVAPIQQLTEGARRIGRGEFDVPLPVDIEDELGELSRTLRTMSRDLSRAYQHLRALNRISEALSADLASSDFVDLALGRLTEFVEAGGGAILLRDGQGNFRQIAGSSDAPSATIPGVDSGLDAIVPPQGSYLRIEDPATVPLLQQCAGDVVAAVSFPLVVDEEIVGVVVLWRTGGAPFSDYEVQLAANVARQIGVGLQTIEKVRMSGELEAARRIQRALFPAEDLRTEAIEVTGALETASETGGDWYTYRRIEDGRVLLLIGDVTGHGVPAALVVSTVDSCLHTLQSTAFDPQPGALLEIFNRVVYRSTRGRLKMTMFASLYDPSSHLLTYANAAHNHPLLTRPGADGVRTLRGRGHRLGHAERTTYGEHSLTLRRGDTLVYYTDGLTDCENQEGLRFGKRRFARAVARAAGVSTGEMIQALLLDVAAFREDQPLLDDIALMVARITA